MSYRREDTAYPAGWLYDRLVGHFARSQVFKDIDSIELGDDFVEVITTAVGSCEVLLALIGDRWLTVTGQDGRRRLDNPDDFVRLEIEAALTRSVRVIPILVEGARMPRADELPASLAKLARRQALELSPSRFDVDTRRLLRVLERTITEAQDQARQQADEAAARHSQQVEQLQGQIRDGAAAQDWDAVVAASGELAALDPAAADPDGLASAAREQITRRQEAERAAAHRQQEIEQLQGQIRDLAAGQDWDAVLAANDQLAALDPAAADPDGLASTAREQITRRQEDARMKTAEQDAYNEPNGLAELGGHAEREDRRDDKPATPGQLGKDLTATQAFDSALRQETSSVPTDEASQIAPDTQPSGLPSQDTGDATTKPPGSWWPRHRVLAPAGAAGAVVVMIGIALLLSYFVGARSPKVGTHNASTSNTTGVYGSVPRAAAGTQYAGTISAAQPPGSAPTWILPIITSADDSVWNVSLFDYLMYRPLYWLVNGVEPEENPSLSLASDPRVSNADKTFTIQLKSSYRWSDGKPITSQDVLFWFDELKAAIAESPSNWGGYTPNAGMPDQVASVTAPNPSTVVFTMKSAVNPIWFWQDELGMIQPMPAHAWAKASATGPMLDFTDPANATKIYNFLAVQSRFEATWATNPLWKVVDGPYQLSSFNNGGFTMTPNKAYGGPTAKKTSSYSSMLFATDTAEYNAVKAGSLDIGYVPIANLPQLNSIKSSQGYLAYGDPNFGFSNIVYNFKDSTGNFDKVISQLYFRQALAHLQDQPSEITAIFNGAAAQAYGPIPPIPNSPYAPPNALTNPYPFSISTASSILKAHGWTVVPSGTDTCAKSGSGSSECGAGIPAGTRLTFNLIYSTSSAVIGEQVTAFASEAKKVGINLILSPSNFNNMIANYDDPAAPRNINKWAMEDFGGFTNPTYPTTFGVFNCSGSINIGGYCDPHADALINGSVSGPSNSAVTGEAEYLTAQQPCLFQPTPTTALEGGAVLVWKKGLSGPPTAFQSITQYYINPEEMYFTSKP